MPTPDSIRFLKYLISGDLDEYLNSRPEDWMQQQELNQIAGRGMEGRNYVKDERLPYQPPSDIRAVEDAQSNVGNMRREDFMKRSSTLEEQKRREIMRALMGVGKGFDSQNGRY